MIKLFQFLISGCWHHWEETTRTGVAENDTLIGYASFCRCTRCGEPRRFNLYKG
jgi:hypothetical protein